MAFYARFVKREEKKSTQKRREKKKKKRDVNIYITFVIVY